MLFVAHCLSQYVNPCRFQVLFSNLCAESEDEEEEAEVPKATKIVNTKQLENTGVDVSSRQTQPNDSGNSAELKNEQTKSVTGSNGPTPKQLDESEDEEPKNFQESIPDGMRTTESESKLRESEETASGEVGKLQSSVHNEHSPEGREKSISEGSETRSIAYVIGSGELKLSMLSLALCTAIAFTGTNVIFSAAASERGNAF